MKNNFLRLVLNTRVLIFLWLAFLLSPSLSVFRLYFVVNNNILGFHIRGFSTFLLYFPFAISLIVFLILVVWFIEFINKKLTKTHRKTLFALSIFSIAFLLVTGGLLGMEQRNYPNYLYEHYGVTVAQLEFMSFIAALELLVFLSILAYNVSFVLGYNVSFAVKKRAGLFDAKLGSDQTERASLFLAVVGFLSLIILSAYPFLRWSVLVGEEGGGFESRVGIHYKYVALLIENTPKESKIIHPPQNNKWPAIGNQPVIRYFLYPRTLVSGALLTNQQFAAEIGNAFFAEMDTQLESTRWPVIDEKERTIVFDEKTEIKYRNIQVTADSERGKVFRILF